PRDLRGVGDRNPGRDLRRRRAPLPRGNRRRAVQMVQKTALKGGVPRSRGQSEIAGSDPRPSARAMSDAYGSRSGNVGWWADQGSAQNRPPSRKPKPRRSASASGVMTLAPHVATSRIDLPKGHWFVIGTAMRRFATRGPGLAFLELSIHSAGVRKYTCASWTIRGHPLASQKMAGPPNTLIAILGKSAEILPEPCEGRYFL